MEKSPEIMLRGFKVICEKERGFETGRPLYKIGVQYSVGDSGSRAFETLARVTDEKALVKNIREALVRTQYAVLLLMNPIKQESIGSA